MCIVLAGRFAGRKAVVVKAVEDGSGEKQFGHAVVAGIERYPRKIVKAMGAKKVAKRSKVKPFVKVVNFTHLMPTRHSVDFDLKNIIGEGALSAENRTDTKKAVRAVFEDKYKNPVSASGKVNDKKSVGAQYLFQKLRF